MLSRIKGRIVHKDLERISPLAVPVMLEIGKERWPARPSDMLLSEAADDADRRGDGHGNDCAARVQTDGDGRRRDRDRRRARASATAAARCTSPSSACSCVSDLHLEKGSSFARRGMLVPPYDTAATLAAARRR